MNEFAASQDDRPDDPDAVGDEDQQDQQDQQGDTEETTVAPESAGSEEAGHDDPFQDAGAYTQASQSSQDRGHEEGHFGEGSGSEESHQPGGSGEQEQRGG